MTATSACLECLRRSWLLTGLAPYIERYLPSESSSSLRDLLALSSEELAQHVAPKVAEQMLCRVAAISELHFRGQIAVGECWATCQHSDHYPESLRLLDDAPWALFGRGDRDLLSSHAARQTVAIVGARRATSYGREVSRELAHELAGEALIVLGGLSFGIDGCAHRGALDVGRTIAVLGCGPDTPYPQSHRPLWRRISEKDLILSELPPESTPWRWTFPARNRIIAGLAGMTVVVEATEKSGSLEIAHRAADLGHIVGAIPGPVTSRISAGPNALLACGATVVRSAQDVLDALEQSRQSPGAEG